MSKIIKISDTVHLTLFRDKNEVPMIEITEMRKLLGDEDRYVILTCDEMNRLIKEYLAQQML